jgi:hypothetical protein
MAVLSTSSTAYIGLGVLLAVLCASWLLRLLTGSRRIAADLVGELAVAWAVLTLALLLAVLQPHFFDPVREMLDEVIFRKSASSSYAERNMWSATALEAFRGTHGLGVGLGGVRTSNWFVSILASTGVLGAVLLGGFLVLTLLRRARRREDAPLVLALQLSMIPWFAMQAVAGTTPDFGVAVGAAFGLIGGLAGVRARAEARSPAVRGEPLEPAEAYRPAPTSSR